MNIAPAALDQIRKTDLPALMIQDGITLKQITPLSFRALCPFHEDKNPSLGVNLRGKSWLWHCFGCGEGGDAIKYVMMKRGQTFPEAVRSLLPDSNGKDKSLLPDSNGKDSEVRDTKVLREVAHYYHEALKENKQAQEYLEKRGLLDPALVKEYRIGFCDGSLPRDPDCLDSFKRLGILNGPGREHFTGCVTFPIEDVAGNIVSLYGRSITEQQHLYLKGPHRGVFNAHSLKGAKRIFLTESIIDALSLVTLGIKETIPLYGTYGFTEDHRKLIEATDPDAIYLCLDNDEAGEKAIERIAEEIPVSIKLFKITLPEGVKDPNEFLLAGASKENLLAQAQAMECRRAGARASGASESLDDFTVEESEREILFQRNGTAYRVRGLNTDRFDILKVSIKITNSEGSHLDTLDLYQARGRQLFGKMSQKLIAIKSFEVERDLKAIVDHLERLQAKRLEKGEGGSAPMPMTEQEKREALEFLKDPHLLERIVTDAKLAGHIGEEDNFLLGYLVAISRKLKKTLGLLIISQSGAGKSALQDKVLFFTPPEDTVTLTRLTDQSLFYQREDALEHKLLAIEEEEGAMGAAYSIRHLLTAAGLINMATMKDQVSGELLTKRWHVKGPTAVMMTTTHSETNYETYNRFMLTTSDESQRQTLAILGAQRERETLEGIIQMRTLEKLQRLHHNAQRLLRSLEIVNPYAERLKFTGSILRARREQDKYLTLIKAICLLRQHQKELKTAHDGKEAFEYIEVDKTDIALANRLAKTYLTKGLDQVSPQGRKLKPMLAELRAKRAAELGKDPPDTALSVKEIRHFTGWSNYQLRKHVRELVELEYLIPVSSGRGKQITYLLAWDDEDESERDIGLQTSDNL